SWCARPPPPGAARCPGPGAATARPAPGSAARRAQGRGPRAPSPCRALGVGGPVRACSLSLVRGRLPAFLFLHQLAVLEQEASPRHPCGLARVVADPQQRGGVLAPVVVEHGLDARGAVLVEVAGGFV